MSNTFKELIDLVQFKLNLTKDQVAIRIGYSRGHLNTAEKNNDKEGGVYQSFVREFSNIIQNVQSPDVTGSNNTGNAGTTDLEKLMKDSIHNLTVSNNNLSIAFVKQANAQEIEAKAREKEADARIIQSTANKILVEVNRDTLSKIPNPLSAKDKYTQDSHLLTRTLGVMAKTLVQQGVYQSEEEATIYLGTLLTSKEEEEISLDKGLRKGNPNKRYKT